MDIAVTQLLGSASRIGSLSAQWVGAIKHQQRVFVRRKTLFVVAGWIEMQRAGNASFRPALVRVDVDGRCLLVLYQLIQPGRRDGLEAHEPCKHRDSSSVAVPGPHREPTPGPWRPHDNYAPARHKFARLHRKQCKAVGGPSAWACGRRFPQDSPQAPVEKSGPPATI